MMMIQSAEQAQSSRHLYTGKTGHQAWVMDYFGTETLKDPSLPKPPAEQLYPVAFMIEELPHAVLGAHFHRARQFQLFVGGDGLLGTEKLVPFSVHYADGFTPYGPICAGDAGIRYLTLRDGFDPGPRYIPDHRSEVRAAGGPYRQTPIQTIPGVSDPIAAARSSIEAFMPPSEDGLAGWLARAGAGARVAAPGHSGGGQYWIIGHGSVVRDDRILASLSCLFVGPDEACPEFVAEGDGASVIILQFPLRASGSP